MAAEYTDPNSSVVAVDSKIAVNANASTDAPVNILPMPTPGDNSEWQQYYERQSMIIQAIDSISPMTNFQNHIAPAIFNNGAILYKSMVSSVRPYGPQTVTLWDSIVSIWANLLVMLIETLVAFAVAYVKFLRVDVR
jgi:ABC-2 type transport system permease protein